MGLFESIVLLVEVLSGRVGYVFHVDGEFLGVEKMNMNTEN